jgi:hypothetical protein
MEEQRALNIVTALANGVNPQTGEVFPGDSPYQSAEIVRALFVAIRAMQARPPRRRSEAPANAGKPWTDTEDAELLQEFDGGMEVAAIAQAHARTAMGIQARLERHGRLLPQADGRPSQRVPRGGHHGTGGVADRPSNGRASRDPSASIGR